MVNKINKFNHLDKVTFIVIVRERCKHLRRALDYYSQFPLKIIVLDSSDRPCRIESENLRICCRTNSRTGFWHIAN